MARPQEGLNISYQGIHTWLIRNFGKADCCENCNTKNVKRYEYALKKGLRYQRIRNNFIQLCPSCHRKYDFTETIRNKLSLAKLGKPSNATGKHWKCKGLINSNNSVTTSL